MQITTSWGMERIASEERRTSIPMLFFLFLSLLFFSVVVRFLLWLFWPKFLHFIGKIYKIQKKLIFDAQMAWHPFFPSPSPKSPKGVGKKNH